MPFEIEGHGWELHVKRLGLQHRVGERVRTYGAYQVFIDGEPATSLSGVRTTNSVSDVLVMQSAEERP
jgi:hypothetical protein